MPSKSRSSACSCKEKEENTRTLTSGIPIRFPGSGRAARRRAEACMTSSSGQRGRIVSGPFGSLLPFGSVAFSRSPQEPSPSVTENGRFRRQRRTAFLSRSPALAQRDVGGKCGTEADRLPQGREGRLPCPPAVSRRCRPAGSSVARSRSSGNPHVLR